MMHTAGYELRVGEYKGPLDKLLELIEERKLEPTAISIAAVTDDFLKYLDELKVAAPAAAEEEVAAVRLRLIADFVVIASRLIFIKSKALLPDLTLTEEEEADIRDLELRLRVLKELKPALQLIANLWAAKRHAWARGYFLHSAAEGGPAVFYPSTGLTALALETSLKELFSAFERFALESETIREHVTSLEDKIRQIVARIQTIATTSFAALADGASRAETVIAFLAVLHLAREQMVLIEQENHLSDIIIKKSDRESFDKLRMSDEGGPVGP